MSETEECKLCGSTDIFESGVCEDCAFGEERNSVGDVPVVFWRVWIVALTVTIAAALLAAKFVHKII